MVKTVLSVAHRGLRDWLVQRISAVFMAICMFGLFLFFVMHPHLTFAEWHALFEASWVKIVSVLFLASILAHAWVGIWTIFTDYVKVWKLRFFLHLIVFFMLMACLLWGIWIVGSV